MDPIQSVCQKQIPFEVLPLPGEDIKNTFFIFLGRVQKTNSRVLSRLKTASLSFFSFFFVVVFFFSPR